MEDSRKDFAKGGRGKPGVSPVLQVIDIGSPVVWVGVMGAVRPKDAGGGGIPHGIFTSQYVGAFYMLLKTDIGWRYYYLKAYRCKFQIK